MRIPELRSPYDKVDGLVYFGRMIDKIRLHTAGKLPAEYVPIWALRITSKALMGAVAGFRTYPFKRCWRDEYTNRLHFRLQQAGMPIEAALTMFDFIDLD